MTEAEAIAECEKLRHEADPRTRNAELEAALRALVYFDAEHQTWRVGLVIDSDATDVVGHLLAKP